MLTIHEEHAMYFPDHSLKEFRKVYECRINTAVIFLNKIKLADVFDEATYEAIKLKIDLDDSRLSKIDQLIAKGCEVKFTNVTQQLKDAGKI